MLEELKEIRNNLIDALEENDRIALRMQINKLDMIIFKLSKSN